MKITALEASVLRRRKLVTDNDTTERGKSSQPKKKTVYHGYKDAKFGNLQNTGPNTEIVWDGHLPKKTTDGQRVNPNPKVVVNIPPDASSPSVKAASPPALRRTSSFPRTVRVSVARTSSLPMTRAPDAAKKDPLEQATPTASSPTFNVVSTAPATKPSVTTPPARSASLPDTRAKDDSKRDNRKATTPEPQTIERTPPRTTPKEEPPETAPSPQTLQRPTLAILADSSAGEPPDQTSVSPRTKESRWTLLKKLLNKDANAKPKDAPALSETKSTPVISNNEKWGLLNIPPLSRANSVSSGYSTHDSGEEGPPLRRSKTTWDPRRPPSLRRRDQNRWFESTMLRVMDQQIISTAHKRYQRPRRRREDLFDESTSA